jgi:hypothetical protein
MSFHVPAIYDTATSVPILVETELYKVTLATSCRDAALLPTSGRKIEKVTLTNSPRGLTYQCAYRERLLSGGRHHEIRPLPFLR